MTNELCFFQGFDMIDGNDVAPANFVLCLGTYIQNWRELTSNSWISPRPEFELKSYLKCFGLTQPSFPVLSPLQPGQRSGEERPQLLDGDAPSENVCTSEKCNVFVSMLVPCHELCMSMSLAIVSCCSRGAAQMEDSWKQRGPPRGGLHTFGQGQESGW